MNQKEGGWGCKTICGSIAHISPLGIEPRTLWCLQTTTVRCSANWAMVRRCESTSSAPPEAAEAPHPNILQFLSTRVVLWCRKTNKKVKRNTKEMDLAGFEPAAFRMQSGRATTALKTQRCEKCPETLDGDTPSGNWTRVSPVAGEYSTTRPTV